MTALVQLTHRIVIVCDWTFELEVSGVAIAEKDVILYDAWSTLYFVNHLSSNLPLYFAPAALRATPSIELKHYPPKYLMLLPRRGKSDCEGAGLN